MEIQLPEQQGVEVEKLAGLFKNMNQSYKLFWFKAIVERVSEGVFSISYEELVNDMIADAWYMVLEYRLNLGAGNTRLVQAVKRAAEVSGIKPSEKKSKILQFLLETDDAELIVKKRELIKDVPYRILSPFIRSTEKNIWRLGKKKLAEVINQQPRLMYYFTNINGLYSRIEVQQPWVNYIRKNSTIMKGWIYYHMVDYLQKRNPNVPGIPNKLYTEEERQDITRARKYWKAVAKIAYKDGKPIKDIYGGIVLEPKNIVIDHFIPWSYLAHDELWNLNPTISKINSSKGNKLPDWEQYIGGLCELEYRAYEMREHSEELQKIFRECEKFHLNDERIREGLYRKGKSKTEFSNELADILSPVYESAKKAGFNDGWIWRN